MTDYISRDEVLEHSEYTGNFNLVVPVRFIKAMKAADVQPVRRGRWIGNEVIQCSNCNFTMNGNAYGKLVYKFFKYCPNCGARMDGEQNDD